MFDSWQPGLLFFIVPRHCGSFGVHGEGISRQHKYLIDASVSIGKGSNTVISLLHYYITTLGVGERQVSLHADSCAGQNKNNYVLFYLLWRVFTGLQKTIQLYLIIAGHTKFAVNWEFGLVKRSFDIPRSHVLYFYICSMYNKNKLNILTN